MSSSSSVIVASANVLSTDRVLVNQYQRSQKTDCYKLFREIHAPIFVLKDDGMKAYMTGQARGIQEGDFLMVQNDCDVKHYRVEKINYYLHPPDTWVAILNKSECDV